MSTADMSPFRIAGPVELRCTLCGETAGFGLGDDGAYCTESLAALLDWARAHQCPRPRLRETLD